MGRASLGWKLVDRSTVRRSTAISFEQLLISLSKSFSYFEMKADVQMLAMLACVFCEAGYKPGDSTPWLNMENGSVSYTEIVFELS